MFLTGKPHVAHKFLPNPDIFSEKNGRSMADLILYALQQHGLSQTRYVQREAENQKSATTDCCAADVS